MKNKIILFATLLIVALSSCKGPNVGPDDVSDGGENAGYIDLNNPMIGQTNTYVRFSAGGYFGGSANLWHEYNSDTLQLKVISINDDYITIEESYINFTDDFDQPAFPKENESIRYRIYDEENQYRIQYENAVNNYESNLFFKENLELRKRSDQTVFPIMNWKVVNTTRALRVTGIIKDVEIHRGEYQRLNVLIDDTPTAYDGQGRTHIYNSNYFIVRSYGVNPWTNTAIGWDLLRPENPEYEKKDFHLESLEDTEWILRKIKTPIGLINVESYFESNNIDIDEIELEFENELNFKCKGGCVKVVGNYTTNGNNISFTTVAAESLTCSFNNELNLFLKLTFGYTASADKLVLKSNYNRIEELIFERE